MPTTCIRCRALLPNATNICGQCGYVMGASTGIATTNDTYSSDQSIQSSDDRTRLSYNSYGLSDQIQNQPLLNYSGGSDTYVSHEYLASLGAEGQVHFQDPGQIHAFSQQLGQFQQPEQVHPSHQQPGQIHASHQQPGQVHPSHQQPGQIHASHQQPGQVHPSHQQPGQFHPSHQQPGQVHPSHQQPGQVHPSHQQPGQVHPSHQQPGQFHPSHQQPGQFYASHQQPHLKNHLKHAKVTKDGCRPSCLTMAVGLGTLIAIITTTVFVAYMHPFSSSAPTPSPKITLTGQAILGQSIILKGSNFPSDGKVIVTLDNQSLAGMGHSTQVPETTPVSMMGELLLFAFQSPISGNWVTISHDGTFAITIHVNEHWSEGSVHVLRMYGQDGKFITSIDFKAVSGVLLKPSLAPCIIATAPQTTMNIGPVTEGASQIVSMPFQLCTSGSGKLDWTSSWDQQQAPWLQIDQNGQLTAPQSQQIQIRASAQNLNAGTYTADVTFSSSSGNSKVVLQVTFLVQPKNTVTCMQANQPVLSFTGQLGQGSPASQTVTIQNGSGCGAGPWSASSDASWLSANPASGSIDVSGSATINVNASLAGLNAGQYTGHITFSPGLATITVNLTVKLPPTCLSVNTSTLNFSVTQGNVPSNQSVTIKNGNQCSAGSWSASSDASWLSANPASGQIGTGGNAPISISIASSTLSAGSYMGHVTFSAGSSMATVTANLTVMPKPCISAQPTSLTFSSTANGADPNPQSVTISTCAQRAGTVSASVDSGSTSWLQVSGGGSISASGQLPFSVSVSPSSAGLAAGRYTGTITFVITTSDNVSAQVTVSVTLSVSSGVTPTPVGVTPTPVGVTPTPVGVTPTPVQLT
jgi:hypothetical protein